MYCEASKRKVFLGVFIVAFILLYLNGQFNTEIAVVQPSENTEKTLFTAEPQNQDIGTGIDSVATTFSAVPDARDTQSAMLGPELDEDGTQKEEEVEGWLRDPVNNPYPKKMRHSYTDNKVRYGLHDWKHFHPRPGEHLDMARIKEEARAKYADRRKPIQEYCKSVNQKNKEVPSQIFQIPEMHMRYSWDHRFFGCSRLKSGYASWKSHYGSIIKYFNYPVDCDKVRCDHIVYSFFSLPKETKAKYTEMTDDVLTFVFSRNPFTHLVSAYNYILDQKMSERNAMLEQYGEEIEKIIETRKSQGLETRQIPPSIFLRRILDNFKLRGVFGIDEHYRPHWFYCGICSVDYDVIGRIDTFDEDVNYILEKLELKDAVEGPAHKNLMYHKTSVEDFYSQLNQEEVMEVYELYKLDFIIEGFNDTLQEFLDMAGDSMKVREKSLKPVGDSE